MELVATVFFSFVLVVLWGVWRWCARWSRRMGIEYDPFLRPTFVINAILTALIFFVILDVWIGKT